MRRLDVQIPTPDGHSDGSLHIPDGDGPWPGVLVFPDAAGLRDTFREMGFLHTGRDTHGLYVSRDARDLYVTNRGSGTVTVVALHYSRMQPIRVVIPLQITA